jgi:hypothetical protein
MTSALRSLKTNLILILAFIVSFFVILVPEKELKPIFILTNASFQKAALPLATTVANFGTVKDLCSKMFHRSIQNLI